MDFKEMVFESFKKIEESGFIETSIENNLKKTIESIVSNCLESYSDFGKSLKEQIKKAVGIDLYELDIPTYNKLIGDTLKKQLEEYMFVQGVEKLKTDMEKMLLGETKDWKLSELIEEFKEYHKEDAREEDWSEISFHCELSGEFAHIDLDPEPEKRRYECSTKLFIHEGKLCTATFGDGKDKKSTKDFNFVGKLYGFEKILFQIYARGSYITIDKDRVDTQYSSDEDY